MIYYALSYRYALLSSAIIMGIWPSQSSFADEVYIKNGDKFKGNLIKCDGSQCLFESLYKALLQVDISSISRMTTSDPVSVDLTTGDRIVGTLGTDKNGTLLVYSPGIGTISINPGKVIGISREATSTISAAPISTPLTREKMSETHGGRTGGIPKQVGQAPDGNQPSTSDQPPPSQSEVIGEEQEEDIDKLREFFLRQTTVLLGPGEAEIDLPLSYSSVRIESDRTRYAIFSPSVRFGLFAGLEGFVNIPFSWASRETVVQNRLENNDEVGLGDISAGLKYALVREAEYWPDIVALIGFQAPTGDNPNPLNPIDVPLGSGRWSVTAGGTAIKSYDPAVVFGSIGYTHVFDGTLNGVNISGGDGISYGFGIGFAINNQISLSAAFSGAYITKIKQNGIEGRESEPMLLTAGLTYRAGRDSYLVPSVSYGLNDDAGDATLTLSYTTKLW